MIGPSPAILFALTAMVCGGLGDLLYKKGARAGIPPHQFLMVQTWTFAPVVVLYGLVTRTLAPSPAALWGGAAGVFAFAGYLSFARSLRTGLVSVNAPIFRLSFVVTVGLAVTFLGERISPGKVMGILLALVAVGLLMWPARVAHAPRRPLAMLVSLAHVGVATAGVGIANFIYKLGLRAGATPSSMLTVQVCVVVSLALGAARVAEGRIRVDPGGWRYPAAAGIVLATAFIGLVEGLARGEASIVVPIAQMGFVVAAALGMLVMKEPPRAGALVGLVAAAASIVLLARS